MARNRFRGDSWGHIARGLVARPGFRGSWVLARAANAPGLEPSEGAQGITAGHGSPLISNGRCSGRALAGPPIPTLCFTRLHYGTPSSGVYPPMAMGPDGFSAASESPSSPHGQHYP